MDYVKPKLSLIHQTIRLFFKCYTGTLGYKIISWPISEAAEIGVNKVGTNICISEAHSRVCLQIWRVKVSLRRLMEHSKIYEDTIRINS